MKFLLTNQETERLMFRQLEHSDYDTWLDLFKDDRTAEMLGMDEFITPKERCDKWFEWTFNRYENELGGQNVLISKEDNKLIGQCGLLVRDIENNFEIEVAYSILSEYRMKGFACEIAKKCRDFAFENDFHDRLISIIIPENLKSAKVATKNGMKVQRQIQYNNKNVNLFMITKSEWEKLLPE